MIRVNKENFEEEVLKYKGKVVVEFWSETCQPCKELLPDVEELSKKYDKDMKFCNIDTKSAPRIAIKQKVLSLPVIRTVSYTHLYCSKYELEAPRIIRHRL